MKKLLFSFPFVALVGCASVTPSSTEKVQINFVAQINGEEFSCGKSYSNIKIDHNSTMWNAGLIGISSKPVNLFEPSTSLK